MAMSCTFLNPLQRDGTSQAQRLLQALVPTSVAVDERDLSDLLLYIRRYARFLRFYTPTNSQGGNWVDFIEHDISTLVSIIQDTDYETLKATFVEKMQQALVAEIAEQATCLTTLFSSLLDLAQLVDSWHRQAIPGLALHTAVERLIHSIVNDVLRTVVALGNRAQEVGYLDEALDTNGFSEVWDLTDIPQDLSLFPSEGTDILEEFEEAVTRLSLLFDRLYEAVVFVIKSAPSYLEETLEDYPEHQPHMALFLAFLKVFRYAQEHLNELTGKHLDFYFHDVLGLERRPAESDQVHVVFGLAKTFSQQRVDKGTVLKAGKDAQGMELVYATDSDLIVNRVVLSEEHGLKSVYVQQDPNTKMVKNIFAAPKANSADGLSAELEGEEKKWQAFGHADLPFARIGFAVASPMFHLTEGLRTVFLTFKLENPLTSVQGWTIQRIAQELHYNVTILASGEKDWVPIIVQRVEITNGVTVDTSTGEDPYTPDHFGDWAVVYVLQLDGTADPVIGYDDKMLKDGFATQHPVIKCLLNNEGLSAGTLDLQRVDAVQDWSGKVTRYEHGDLVRFNRQIYRAELPVSRSGFLPTANPKVWKSIPFGYPYHYFQQMEIKGIQIALDVKGVRSLVLENDVGLLDPAKPFHPFGPNPRKGSSFLIGSSEVFHKPLTNLDLTIQWADLPEVNFTDHYQGYQKNSGAIILGNEDFTATVLLLNRGQWVEAQEVHTLEGEAWELVAKGTALALFTPEGTSEPPQNTRGIRISNLALDAGPSLKSFERFDTTLTQGFLKLQLNRNFLHSEYPRVLADAAKPKDATDPPEFDPTPNPPYTPLMAELQLDYEAETNMEFSQLSKNDFADRVEQIFQIGPFGQREIYPIPDDAEAEDVPIHRQLVPEFLVTVKGVDGVEREETAQGTWYLGLEQVTLPQNLSLLIQVAEGSEDPQLQAQHVVWSYLTAKEWVDFQTTEIIADGTNGLLTSGVLQLALSNTMVNMGTLMPKGVYWIKASVVGPVGAVPHMIAVHPQAVVASFQDQQNDPDHLAQALPAQTISKLKVRDAAIRSVSQPYASFAGRVMESDEAFSIRVSERLRHKGRATMIFDYERLVLEHFPEVYKVKCINHTNVDSEFSPGYVRLVVVPNLRNKNAVDPLRPQFSRNVLERITSWLATKASNFVEIEVANPEYEQVRVIFQVRFHPGRDKGFYTTQLNQDIIRFLSPWLHDDVADLTFGGRIHRSSILKYVEDREYVDFVTNFQMDHILSNATVYLNVEEAKASSSSAALVSHEQHIIGHDIVSCADAPAVPLQEPGEDSSEDIPSPPEVPPGFERYLGNRNSRELHDLSNLKPQCQIDEIAEERRIYFKRTTAAIVLGYDYCAYCFGRELSQR